MLYDDDASDTFRSTKYDLKKKKEQEVNQASGPTNATQFEAGSSEGTSDHAEHHDPEQGHVESEIEEPEMNLLTAIFLLVVVTVVSIPNKSCLFCQSHYAEVCRGNGRVASGLNLGSCSHRQNSTRVHWRDFAPNCWKRRR
jgi:hypothetical protein